MECRPQHDIHDPAAGPGCPITHCGCRTEFRITYEDWPRLVYRLELRSPHDTPDHSIDPDMGIKSRTPSSVQHCHPYGIPDQKHRFPHGSQDAVREPGSSIASLTELMLPTRQWILRGTPALVRRTRHRTWNPAWDPISGVEVHTKFGIPYVAGCRIEARMEL